MYTSLWLIHMLIGMWPIPLGKPAYYRRAKNYTLTYPKNNT